MSDKADVNPEQVGIISGDWIKPEEFEDLFEAYMGRQWDEDITKITQLDGMTNIIRKLKTDAKNGLTTEEVNSSEREQIYDNNKKPEPERSTFCEFCWEAMKDDTMRILLLCGIVSLILGSTVDKHPQIGWIDGFAIIVAVVIVVLVTALNDY